MQHQISLHNRGTCACDTQCFNFIDRIAQSGGIDHVKRHAVDQNRFFNPVARGAGYRRDDGGLFARKRIEQRGFTDIGPARKHHRQAGAQACALRGTAKNRSQSGSQCIKPRPRMLTLEKINLFIGKVERRFDQHAQGHQRIFERMHLARKHAIEGTHCRARRLRRRRLDQIRHALGLRQIELAVQISAAGKFPRQGDAATQFDAALQQ